MNKLLLGLVIIFELLSAHAELINISDWDTAITANSDNRFRGISINQTAPGLVFDINQNFNNGIYVGAQIPTVSGDLGYGLHIDPYVGYKFNPINDLTIDFGDKNYLYPEVTVYNTNEIYSSVRYKLFTVKANKSLENYFSYPNSTGSTYYEFAIDYPINNKFTVHTHVGKVTVENNKLFNYQTHQTSATYQYSKDWSVTGTYIENKQLTDIAKNYGFIQNGHPLWKDTFIVSLKKEF